MCCPKPMCKIPDQDPNPPNYATVYEYATGEVLDTVDKKTYTRYLDEIGDCDIGAVLGDDYGFEEIIYMEEN